MTKTPGGGGEGYIVGTPGGSLVNNFFPRGLEFSLIRVGFTLVSFMVFAWNFSCIIVNLKLTESFREGFC